MQGEIKGEQEKDPFAVALGVRLQAAADDMGWTPAEAAAHMGMHRPTWAGYVSGNRTFPCKLLPRAAKVFGKSINYFFGLPDPRGLTPVQQTIVALSEQMDERGLGTFVEVGEQLVQSSKQRSRANGAAHG